MTFPHFKTFASWSFVLSLIIGLGGCSSGMQSGEDLLESRLRQRPSLPAKVSSQPAGETARKAAQPGDGGFMQPGTNQLAGFSPAAPVDGVTMSGAPVTLNLLNAPTDQAAKAVLGDTLGVAYSIDSKVQGTITIQTPAPVTRRQLLALFESALRDNGAAIIAGAGSYRIVALADVSQGIATLTSGSGNPDDPGTAPRLITLKYVSAENMKKVLDPMLPSGVVVATDQSRNALILSATPREIASILDTISVFDVDWMRGMSFALVPVTSSAPGAIVQELDEIFATKAGPLKGVVRFVPNNRLKAVLVISSRSKYLGDASRWIKKLDGLAGKNELRMHVYHVQNRTASDLAKVLDGIFATAPKSGSDPFGKTDAAVAPKFSAVTAGSPLVNEDGVVQPAEPGITPGETTPGDTTLSATVENASDMKQTMRVVADDSNNALLIYSNEPEFEKVKAILEDLDTIPNQVLLEAVIAEVSLDDSLKYGVRWYLGQQENRTTFSDSLTGSVSSVFPGFSYFLKANDIGFTLNALSSVTNVRVLSAPSLVVLDNHTASLQVGDQVPVVTQSAQSTSSRDAPILSSVELKDTGVILNVTPRVNDSGLVTLEIEQEVSSVVKTETSGIDSPTIRQRKLKTSVVVSDNEALALGGLIQERETSTKSKVPVLGDVPVLGAAFRRKDNSTARTELIIFIQPRVIRDREEARQVTEEFRRELMVRSPRVPQGEAGAGANFMRILN